jgi:starch synthase
LSGLHARSFCENLIMKVAVVAAEMTPYAKAGGLADVIGALPAELQGCGAMVSVVIPGYKAALAALPTETIGGQNSVTVGNRREGFGLRTGIGPAGVPVFFIVHDAYFGREAIYGENGQDYPDAIERFVFFARATARVLSEFLKPDLVHAHDWHAAALPLLMRADPALRAQFERTASLFTIHNLAFQGLTGARDFALLNLDRSYMSIGCLEFYGRMNLMKGAIVIADGVSTVSPTYAREVSSDPSYGFGLEGVLRARGERFTGILNGADYNEWNPATDQHIAARYSPDDPAGKAACARALRTRTGLAIDSKRALVGMVSRVTAQKGFDLLVQTLDELLGLDLDLVILGNGEPEYEATLRSAEREHPDRIRLSTAFDNDLAHQIQAGCDMFLMPSRFEPCGLTQMYALKYGTVPVVRATGGLADSISEFDLKTGLGNGFVFRDYQPAEMIAAMRRALEVFSDRTAWKRLMANCFAADFSWAVAAARYMDLYRKLIAERTQQVR